MKRKLHIDVETFSDVDLKTSGLAVYVDSPEFEIMLFSYAFDDNEVITVDYGEPLPDEVLDALPDPEVLKIAHNAQFEIATIEAYYGIKLDPAQWFCTMVAAAYLGLPQKLEDVATVLGLTEQKDKRGGQLIVYFAKPCKPTNANKGRTRNLPHHAPEKWQEYKGYNAQDVRTEIGIDEYLETFDPMPDFEWRYWAQDQEINRRGAYIDREFVEGVIDALEESSEEVLSEMRALTGLSNPNSLGLLKDWINTRHAVEFYGPSVIYDGKTDTVSRDVKSLNKVHLAELLADKSITGDVRRVLELREQASKTSNSKFSKMLAYLCSTGRMYYLIQFYGANRTGRFAGRGIQPQNMKKTPDEKRYPYLVDTAREAFRKGIAGLLFDDIAELASTLVRTAIAATPGHMLVSSDFAAIEARVLAWLCGEEWVLEVFNTHGKIYEATASKMYGVPFESIDRKSPYRQRGKVADLALGYGGGVGALITMGAIREGIPEDDLPGIRDAYRISRPKTVKLWRQVEMAAKYVIQNKSMYRLNLPGGTLVFSYHRGYMFIELPSGRKLSYYGARVEMMRNKFGNMSEQLTYWGIDQTTKTWRKDNTYGGSLVENIVQAIARDCLVEAMYRLRHLPIILHIHDEIIVEVPEEAAEDTLAEMRQAMAIRPRWAPGLPLTAEGYVSKYYKKD